MKITNQSQLPVAVKLTMPDGQPNYVHLAPKSKVTLPAGSKIDANWHVANPQIVVVKE